MKAIITVGLSFGDCCKGSAVDYLCRLHNADLVVRYSGGHQCGHNVVLPDGTHHCFQQFGSGTFAGVPTYLGKNMIISPQALAGEAMDLIDKGVEHPESMLFINWSALVTTPWHALLNQMKEISRNDEAHGSCGVGIGETRRYWLEYGCDAVCAGDFIGNVNILQDKLEIMRQRLLLEANEIVGHTNGGKLLEMYEVSPRKWGQLATRNLTPFTFVNGIPRFSTAIFEGAQGILLDENYGFHPHTTWSTTTSRHAFDELEGMVCDKTVLGIIRTYQTRHGNGPLPTWTPKRKIKGEYNKENEWQNNFRIGSFDVPLTKWAIAADGNLDGLFVTCMDHLTGGKMVYAKEYNPGFMNNPCPIISYNAKAGEILGKIIPVYDSGQVEDVIAEHIGLPINYTSHGNTYEDKICLTS